MWRGGGGKMGSHQRYLPLAGRTSDHSVRRLRSARQPRWRRAASPLRRHCCCCSPRRPARRWRLAQRLRRCTSPSPSRMTGQTRATPPPSVRTQAVPVYVYRHTRVSHPLLDGAEKRVTASDVRSPSFPPCRAGTPRWHPEPPAAWRCGSPFRAASATTQLCCDSGGPLAAVGVCIDPMSHRSRADMLTVCLADMCVPSSRCFGAQVYAGRPADDAPRR